jgi:NitT/TauT family transport system substrate-binding protein
MEGNLNALAQGQVDVIQVFEPFVTRAELRGIGISLQAASGRGPTAYTSFITTTSHLSRYDAAFRAMAAAIRSFPPWLASEGSVALARVVRGYYPHVEDEVLARSLARYQAAHLWSCRPEISRAGFDRLAQSMQNSGFIRTRAPYESCVAPWAIESA